MPEKISKRFLLKEYAEHNKSVKVIAKEIHRSVRTINNYLDEYKIPRRIQKRFNIPIAWLREEFLNKNKTIKEIAAYLGCSQGLIETILRKHKIVKTVSQKRLRDSRFVDLTGNIYGRLTVLRMNVDKPYARWLCLCECGNEYVASSHGLKHLKVSQCRECSCPRQPVTQLQQAYWSGLKSGAKRRGIKFSITKEYSYRLFLKQRRKCKLSGVDIAFAATSRRHKVNRETTASLDRIDSTRGYIKGNVQWLHKDVNMMKTKLTQDEFKEYCRLITENDNH